MTSLANQGQEDRQVAFTVRGRDASAYVTAGGATYVFDSYVLKLDFVGARAVEPVGGERLPGVVNYLKGDQSQWKTGIPTFGRIVYHDLWPRIDLVWRGPGGRLEYDLLVHPGADPNRIRFRYRGAKLSVQKDGLVIETPVRTLREGPPLALQDGREVPAHYELDDDEFRFRLAGYDRSRPLLIDPPSILYAGFLGGSGSDAGDAIAVDTAGNAYVAGGVRSTTDFPAPSSDFPTTAGAFDTKHNGNVDVFVAKLNTTGSAVVYATFLGGGGTGASSSR